MSSAVLWVTVAIVAIARVLHVDPTRVLAPVANAARRTGLVDFGNGRGR